MSTFKALLNHGTKRRPAKHHLDHAKTRYLLITSADTKGEARNLAVRGLEEWPEAETFPKSLSKVLPHTPEGRVAIWGALNERTLDLEIKDILGALLRVPSSQHDSCRTKLRDEALSRMRGTVPGVWRQEDLLHVIREYSGYLASAPALEAFVPPANDPEKETSFVCTASFLHRVTWLSVGMCRRTDPGLAANLRNRRANIALLNDKRLLRVCEFRCFHRVHSFSSQESGSRKL